jgi:hypothetical protein
MDTVQQQLDEDRSVTRLHNRALRSVVRSLRRKGLREMEHNDELFAALCEADIAAEHAMGELWGSAAFDCGPQDYEFMVERSITAVREYNERHTNPVTVCIDSSFGYSS